MSAVTVREGEPFEGALRRFRRQRERAGILSELRKREFHEKPSVRKKGNMPAAKKRAVRELNRSTNKGLC